MFDKERYKIKALKILSPIKPVDKNTIATKDFLLRARRSRASYDLPLYYLVYFLFAELLDFENLGQFEKVAWSFPIDYKGRAFLIEFRKFGIGVFVQDIERDEDDAAQIVKRINGAVKCARPFFDNIAEEAVKASLLNVTNKNRELYQRYEYLLGLYEAEYEKYLSYKEEYSTIESGSVTTYKSLGFEYRKRSDWLAISCIEAFFSWTEHLFVHLAIVAQGLSDGEELSKLIDSEWKVKYKKAIPDDTVEANKFYDELLIVRQQLRNFVAHGAFGKDGNAFAFHSHTGAVPVMMSYKRRKNRFSLYGSLSFIEKDVIAFVQEFIDFLWKNFPAAMYYTQELCLPTILTLAADGTYNDASKDMESMKLFSDRLMSMMDDSANMDW